MYTCLFEEFRVQSTAHHPHPKTSQKETSSGLGWPTHVEVFFTSTESSQKTSPYDTWGRAGPLLLFRAILISDAVASPVQQPQGGIGNGTPKVEAVLDTLEKPEISSDLRGSSHRCFQRFLQKGWLSCLITGIQTICRSLGYLTGQSRGTCTESFSRSRPPWPYLSWSRASRC